MTKQEQEFEDEILECVRICKDDLGYNPTRFIQMCERYGVVGACKNLLATDQIHDGFTELVIRGRHRDLSIESIATKPKFMSLFSNDELERANDRLGK